MRARYAQTSEGEVEAGVDGMKTPVRGIGMYLAWMGVEITITLTQSRRMKNRVLLWFRLRPGLSSSWSL